MYASEEPQGRPQRASQNLAGSFPIPKECDKDAPIAHGCQALLVSVVHRTSFGLCVLAGSTSSSIPQIVGTMARTGAQRNR